MCLICIEVQKDKMTLKEAVRARAEILVVEDKVHYKELNTMLQSKFGKERFCKAEAESVEDMMASARRYDENQKA